MTGNKLYTQNNNIVAPMTEKQNKKFTLADQLIAKKDIMMALSNERTTQKKMRVQRGNFTNQATVETNPDAQSEYGASSNLRVGRTGNKTSLSYANKHGVTLSEDRENY